jgi:hypothetical protein
MEGKAAGMCISSSGDIYIADDRGSQIFRVTPSGVVSLAVKPLRSALALCMYRDHLYVGHEGGVSRVTLNHDSGRAPRIVEWAEVGQGDGYICAMAIDERHGYVYVTDDKHHIYQIAHAGKDDHEARVSVYAGDGGRGVANGAATHAKFGKLILGLAVDQVDCSLLVADGYNNRIRRVYNGNVSTLAEVIDPLRIACGRNGRIVFIGDGSVFDSGPRYACPSASPLTGVTSLPAFPSDFKWNECQMNDFDYTRRLVPRTARGARTSPTDGALIEAAFAARLKTSIGTTTASAALISNLAVKMIFNTGDITTRERQVKYKTKRHL